MKEVPFILESLIRVVPRDTGFYKNLPNDKDLSPSEKVQILQGDIPYFFRYLNSSKIYYLNLKTNKPILENLPYKVSHHLAQQMMLNISKNDLSLSLKKTGSLQLLKYFFSNKFYGNSVYKKLKINLEKNLMIIQFHNEK